MKFIKMIIQRIFTFYVRKRLGRYGKGSGIGFPCYLGTPSHIFTGDYSLIQPNCRFIIGGGRFELGKWSGISCNSIIVTGNHTPTVGLCRRMQELSGVNDLEKDVIVGDDCWVGAGVTLLSGTRIGRGCVVAAGAVVNSSSPPYSVVGGIPAKVIAYTFDVEQILRHEQKLYPPENRMSREELEEIHSKYFEGKKRIGKELPDDFDLSGLERYGYLQYAVN